MTRKKRKPVATLEDLCYAVSEIDWQTVGEIDDELTKQGFDYGALLPLDHFLDCLVDKGRLKRRDFPNPDPPLPDSVDEPAPVIAKYRRVANPSIHAHPAHDAKGRHQPPVSIL